MPLSADFPSHWGAYEFVTFLSHKDVWDFGASTMVCSVFSFIDRLHHLCFEQLSKLVSAQFPLALERYTRRMRKLERETDEKRLDRRRCTKWREVRDVNFMDWEQL